MDLDRAPTDDGGTGCLVDTGTRGKRARRVPIIAAGRGSQLYDLPNVPLTPTFAGCMGGEHQRLADAAAAELARDAACEPFTHPVHPRQLSLSA
ncbi:hypothetical protein AB0B66_40625 [Catellatospora sp. NPDC049111]|uniref:hypothetical protein n=1 Tax=Catellatospora sp. NPDC049111 TaxID=3155271 RepID=UPI0033DE45EE